jgi:DNA-binding transcriptional LysR family regulator
MLNQIDLSRTDLNLLVLFEAVLEEGHVGRAATRLNLTPSAVSHGLGRLRRLLHDPLFLRTPRGVVPTARALELAVRITDALARVRGVISTAAPFDPATSERRFTISAPDGVSTVLLPRLLAGLRERAPGIGVSLCQLLPARGQLSPEQAWRTAFTDLESRATDLVVIPSDHIPARFHAQCVYEEDFVVAMRAGHPFAEDPTLERYCAAQHLVVSLDGDPWGFVDEALAQQGRVRRVALTVPNFLLALSALAETSLISALPRRFVAIHAARFGVVGHEPPLRLPHFRLKVVAPKAAMLDTGLAWLLGALVEAQL